GKGLDALILARDEAPEQGTLEVDINLVEPNRAQPREDFNQADLEELAESIKAVGIIQPLIVKKEEGYYKIVAGERRWRAARLAALKTVPVITREADEQDTLALALIENLQRVDLNPLEEAVSYKRLMDEFGFTQEDIAKKIGKSRSAIANILRYLALPGGIKEHLKSGAISQGHAKVLLGVENTAEQQKLAGIAVSDQLSVRALERLVKDGKARKITEPKSDESSPYKALHKSLERELEGVLGTKISIKTDKSGERGRIEIEFYNNNDFDRLYLRLKN
ncbi:MAG: ParB/RepB/Spo0J family partition protein, partial [Clostridiales bacterium]|nr:ParB/RepB/Spo0J family partition protein [Clostridiales bacterium]